MINGLVFCLLEFILIPFPCSLLATRIKLTCITKFNKKAKSGYSLKRMMNYCQRKCFRWINKWGTVNIRHLPLINQNNIVKKDANNKLQEYPKVINVNVNSVLLNVTSNGFFITLYLTYDSKMWRNGAIKTKWMLIPEDIKHIMLDFHSSIVNTKSSLKYKSFPTE